MQEHLRGEFLQRLRKIRKHLKALEEILNDGQGLMDGDIQTIRPWLQRMDEGRIEITRWIEGE